MDDTIVQTPANEPVILITRTFHAPPELVFRCYTDPVHLAHFWGPRDATTTSRLDLRPGGVWHTQWQYANRLLSFAVHGWGSSGRMAGVQQR